MAELDGKRIAFVATDGVEQVELTQPWEAVEAAGATPVLLSLGEGSIQGVNHLDKGDTFPVDRRVADAHAVDFHGLVIPGGVANPDALRVDEDVRRLVREWVDQEVVTNEGLVTSRPPDDLPAFCAKIVEELAKGRHMRTVA